ncbi:hypothetical protein THAOC_06868, partial [Thalassiosira oceanica]
MTVAGGAVITPRMLDVLSSGGATNGEALAQGPYLKIRWAVGVSRGRWDRRRGVEEALGFVMRLYEEIPGGAPCKEIEQGYHPPRESSIALAKFGGRVVEAAQRVRKKGGRNRFSAKITKKRDFS